MKNLEWEYCLHCNTHAYTRERDWHCDCEAAEWIKFGREMFLSALAFIGVPLVVIIAHIGSQ